MTIRDVLEADWTIDEIDITVRDKESRYIMRYRIGRDVKPGNSMRFDFQSELGEVYNDSGMKTLFMKRIIQFRQQEKIPKGKEGCVGVLLNKIPNEILELKVEYMSPYKYGRSDGMHGYYFTCHVDTWSGIPGENKQMEPSDLLESEV